MEHFIRITFWIFTLLFTLSGCKPAHNLDEYNIKLLQTDVECPNDTILYSPTNVMPKCFTSALKCVYKELFQTAKEECDDKNKRIGQAEEALQELTDEVSKTGSVPTTSNECACEKWLQVPYEDFLSNYKTLIELILSEIKSRNASR